MRLEKNVIGLCLLIMLVGFAACGQPAPDTATNETSSPPTPTAAPATAESIAAHPAVVQVLQRVESQGIQPQLEGESLVEWLLPEPGISYRLTEHLAKERLVFHLYADAAGAAARAAIIPESGDTGMTDWIDVPHFFQCDAVIALYLGTNDQVLSALTESCGPQFAGRS
ncbi:MAG TPA: hypothetical protein VGD58_22750 [Herpetosiphonaceae bacterium]